MRKIIFFLSLIWSSTAFGYKGQDSIKMEKKLNWTLGTRNFFMSTAYYDDFKNDFSWAQSAFVKLETSDYKGFYFTGRYAVFAKIMSSDLVARDPITGGKNRYEAGLLDVTDLGNNYFGRLEEFQLKFRTAQLSFAAGRMPIHTALINPQDGRLSPTFVEGGFINFTPDKFNTATLNYISRISPRSTDSWFGIGESIGLYPIGLDTEGNPSAYIGNVFSDFITVFDWKHVVEEDAFSFEFNHTYVQNISSTFLTQFQRDWKLANSKRLVSGLQIMFQHGIKDGGNKNASLRYKDPYDENWIVGARVGMRSSKYLWHLNFTHIGGRGRYLSPREWGKDPFFTFIPRERNEGFSEVTAITAYYESRVREKGLIIYGHVGLHFLPKANTFKINKYAFPSYAQGNLGIKYTPITWGKGLDFHGLILTKMAIEKADLKPGWTYNKVNLVHFNLIANYTIQWK